ncbi:metal ABC transporter solute-binding protein, Zn/Mn family [Citricoccus sp. GCM10030269]|uniref:metal ABC transporter solute-binding protein, Zn/Mn family n=1 Tax=Citricoccus sp. GCM10030269 TaxID=3273388 RepID=UPI003619CD92
MVISRSSQPPRFLTAGLTAVALIALTACSAGNSGGGDGGGGSAGGGDPVAVATTTQLGSIVEEITRCAGAESATVMGPGDDPHDFSPSSQQIAEMTRADLVVTNGLGLESGMQTALDNATADGAEIMEVAPEVDPLPFTAVDHHAEEHEHEHEHEGHEHSDGDPHFWMDVSRMAKAAELIGAKLEQVTGDEQYATCGTETADELSSVDEEITAILDEIPEDRRTLVTDHAAYNYFADAYGFEIAGVVIPGGSTDAEPSSEEMASLVDQMEQEGADALVTGAGSDNKLVDALSAETGGEVPVVKLYEGALGAEGSGAETYAEAMKVSAETLADALPR